MAGLIYNFLPFMTLPMYAVLDKVDPRLIEAASDLYSSPFTGLRKVTFPLSLARRGVRHPPDVHSLVR